MTIYSHFDNDKETINNYYGTVDKKNGGDSEGNINAFYNNRPYKQNEFDEVCQHQFPRKPGVLESYKSKVAESQCCSPYTWLVHLFPILEWLPKYKWATDFSQDVVSGVTVAVVHIPQGMAYSILAGVPPITGIYMAFFPVLIYMLMGTSRHLSMGTFSVICMMTAKSVLQYSDPKYLMMGDQSADRNSSAVTNSSDVQIHDVIGTGLTPVQVASAVCLMVGMWHVLLGFLKLGSLSVLMSDSMISGFTSGTAWIVIASQIKHVFGLRLPRHSGPLKIVLAISDVVHQFDQTNWLAFEIAMGSTIALIIYTELCKGPLSKILPVPLPIELITVVLGTLASSHFQLTEKFHITTVGYIPTGLPAPELPPLWLLPNLIVDGLVISIIAFSINISMASILAKKKKYKVDSNQELLASGFSNIFASFFSCVPFAASLSRSLIQMQTGGQTQLASGVSCGCLAVVLLYIGPFFQPLPHCVLTAIVIVAMKGMILQMGDLVTYWQESAIEGIVWASTFVAVVLLDIDYGLAIGICISLVCVIFMSQKVLVSKLGRIFTTDIYVESDRYQSALEIPNIIIVRILGSLNFVNKEKVMKKINKMVAKSSQRYKSKPVVVDNGQPGEIKVLIVDMMAVSSVDSSTVKAFLTLHRTLKAQGVTLKLVQFTEPARKAFWRCNFFKEFPESCLFPTIHDAVLDSLPNNNNNNSLDAMPNNNSRSNGGPPVITSEMRSSSNLTEVTTLGSLTTLESLSLQVSGSSSSSKL